jgi:hypothetical protein
MDCLHPPTSRFLHRKQPATLALALVTTVRRDGWSFRPGRLVFSVLTVWFSWRWV